MARMQVELREKAPRMTREPPPSYEEATSMPKRTPIISKVLFDSTSRPCFASSLIPSRVEDSASSTEANQSGDGDTSGVESGDNTLEVTLNSRHTLENESSYENVVVEITSDTDPYAIRQEIDGDAEESVLDISELFDEDEERYQFYARANSGRDENEDCTQPHRSRSSIKQSSQTKTAKQDRDQQTRSRYDQHTYTVISRLRAVNKRLAHQLDQQSKLVAKLNEEKKQYLQLVDTLRADVQMHRQELRALQPGTAFAKKPHHNESTLPIVHRPQQQQQQQSVTSREEIDGAKILTPRSPASLSKQPPNSSSSSRRPRTSPRVKTPVVSVADRCCGMNCGKTNVHDGHLANMYKIKLEKAEEERKEMQVRHAHQLANYSHELSRLERLLEKAHDAVQEKDNELQLQRARQLYSSTPVTPSSSGGAIHRRNSKSAGAVSGLSQNNTSGRRDNVQGNNIFLDDIWKGLLPLSTTNKTASTRDLNDRTKEATPVVTPGDLAPLSFTTHVGQAFEQLLNHQLMSFHDNTLDRCTREWLFEVRQCGSQMLTLHRSFQVLAHSLQRLAESTYLYQLAERMAEECCSLLQAEQALVLVVDKSEQEFWCRLPSRRSPEESMDNKADTNKRQMGTVRSTLLPLANTTGPPSATVPCGLASLVYHTKRPLLLPAGQMARHAKYSMALDNSDRLVVSLNASTLLVPIIHENRVLAVVQVCGKLTQVEALGLTIALERSAGFTPEDQTLLSLVCHFTSGLIPKVAYFTDVESNKVNEETFIQLAPEIFTCLHFDELGKVVIENAKSILDADRCSLFVADSASRTLHNWHSDISGAGVEVYQRSAKKSEGGMTIHFGQGIVGLVAETQQPINIPDAYDDPRFNSAWDVKTHYRTKSMLTVPIISNVSSSEKSGPSRAGNYKGNDDDEKEQNTATPPKDQVLLGVVQVINKSGGAPFRAKDEFLLQTISKLIALAIENSQLFQRNQELCWNVGKLIADGDIVEAIVTLGTAAEQIIGVEGAAVYVMDPDTQELVTFHHKRRYRISLVEPAYRGSIMDDAVHSQQLTITNDVSKAAQYNAFVDSINGISARNVLFAPLLVEESDSVLPELCKPSGTGASSDNGQRLVGLLQLVNIKGRKDHFDQHDLFLSIVQSQSCSVLAAILEKQRMLRQKEQIALLLDASMSFFKEVSVIGVINAVYNACVSIFDATTTAQLFLWEESIYPVDKDRERHMWTSKISPHAAASLAPRTTLQSSTTNIHNAAPDARGVNAMSFVPSIGAQSRKLSVVADKTLRAPTSEGLFQHVLMRGSAVIVKTWVVEDFVQEVESVASISCNNSDQNQNMQHQDTKSFKVSAGRRSSRLRVDKYALRATRSDIRLGFARHAVVACPVWGSNGQEIVGVLVLQFPHDHAAVKGGVQSEQLSTLPILTRQISGALGVCQDLITVSTRARRMQDMLELSRQVPKAAMSLTLTSRGHLGSFSQPINVLSRSFSGQALFGELHPMSVANLTVHSLYMDEEGHRWAFLLSGVTAHEMSSDHYIQWIGKSMELLAGHTEAEVFARLRLDLQNVYARKEVITGVIDTRPSKIEANGGSGPRDESGDTNSPTDTLPRPIVVKIRQTLWGFTDTTWQVDLARASHALFGAFVRTGVEDGCKGKKLLSRRELQQALGTEQGGAGISMGFAEWDQLHGCFADKESGLVDVEAMLAVLRPHLKSFPLITYELAPVLDTVTQVVVSVQVLLHG